MRANADISIIDHRPTDRSTVPKSIEMPRMRLPLYIVDQLKPDTMDCKRLRRGVSVTEELTVEKPQQLVIL